MASVKENGNKKENDVGRYELFCKYVVDYTGGHKRSMLDFLDVFEERAASDAERAAIGKIKKRVHNDVGSLTERLKALYYVLDASFDVVSEIPQFGNKGKNKD